ncbi:hypothetical protein ONS95_005306 [Cadophora gregata]|uniref:uncharacterized protein n=1 Tax=Cadophora gregata TaxID=51156 RepID=UPI0026DACE39|nr:uncharacterized protein ONS95_005306 [Cadophora gregata]KAK0103273.1 hypothetical protein ONS95_005306 [Cadophora gregata]KAK0107466.1 hypothetical protein ONS96_003279 [Cadophora gregata f. sp. sojae]
MSTAVPFKIYHEDFKQILGSSPKLECLLEDQTIPFAHEAGVFIPEDNTLFITSNQFPHPTTGEKSIQISKITLSNGSATCEKIETENVTMANGGVNYQGGVLFCAQGNMSSPGGLAFMSTSPPYKSSIFLSNFYGRSFNSVNDVVIHSDGSIWFTDPNYGYEQGVRPRPVLPNQVYRYDPASKAVRAVADGFGRPNGLCFSPDETILFVTDTDWIHGDGSTEDSRASTIYAFDIVTYSGQPFLINRRLFAYASSRVPDGIKCDMDGNVYSGCGDGVNIWSPGGVHLGTVEVQGGAANFCFGRKGELFILNETRLWRAQLGSHVKGALLKI